MEKAANLKGGDYVKKEVNKSAWGKVTRIFNLAE